MKHKFFAVPICFMAILVISALPAHAAVGEKAQLPKEEAVVLQQALDVLKKILDQLSARADSGDQIVLGNAGMINASLADIHGKLTALDTTLLAFDGQTQELAARPPLPASAVVKTQNEGPQLTQTFPQGSLKSPLAAEVPNGAIPRTSDAAGLIAVSNRASGTEIVWLSLLVLAACGVMWWLWPKSRNRAPVITPATKRALLETKRQTEPNVSDLANIGWD